MWCPNFFNNTYWQDFTGEYFKYWQDFTGVATWPTPCSEHTCTDSRHGYTRRFLPLFKVIFQGNSLESLVQIQMVKEIAKLKYFLLEIWRSTSGWRPFGPLDLVLHVLQALKLGNLRRSNTKNFRKIQSVHVRTFEEIRLAMFEKYSKRRIDPDFCSRTESKNCAF